MNDDYIAGFFDGEGSAMILTVRVKRGEKMFYRFRPVVKISQKTRPALQAIQRHLGYGTVVYNNGIHILEIEGLDGVIDFATKISSRCEIKGDALKIVEDLARFQLKEGNKFRNRPYTKDETLLMLDLRDRLFALNQIRKARIQQKYSRDKILSETIFVTDLKAWHRERAYHSLASATRPLHGRGRRVVKNV